MTEEATTVVDAFGTPVEIRPGFWGALALLWALMTWVAGRGHPERPFLVRLAVGFLSGLAMISADVGHALAHTVSARMAGGPTDRIVLSHGMPRTLYEDNAVPPAMHRGRSLGGPIFSGVSLLAALVSRSLAPQDSIIREVLTWSAVGHAFIFGGCLAPLPFVDGGVLLKWSLVDAGRSADEADIIVQEVDLAAGAALAASGVALATTRHKLPALALLAGGIVAIGAGLGKIR
jgi:hypothetical protein